MNLIVGLFEEAKRLITQCVFYLALGGTFWFLLTPISAFAQVPDFINYQSRLRDSGGVPVTATTTMQFSIYNTASTGSSTDTPSANGPLLWTETYDQVSGSCAYIDPDDDGYLTVRLGACVPFPSYLDFATDDLHLGVKIEGDDEVSPRARMGSTPYAYTAEKVRGAAQSAIGTTSVETDAALTVEATSTTGVAAVFRGVAGQVADIFQAVSATGERWLTLAANGFFGVGTSTPTAQLTVDGDTDLYGDVFVQGTTTFDGDVIPGEDDVYSLGTADRRWKDLYVGPGTIYVGDTNAFGALGYSISQEYILFDPDGDTLHDIVFDYRGHVGIGTTTPNSKLTIDSLDFATGTVMEITDLTNLTTGTAFHIDSNSTSTAVRNLMEILNVSPLAINTTALYVDNPYGIAASFLGDVGIGTTGGGNALTVNGGVTISSSTPHTATSSLYNLDGELYWSERTVDTAFEQVTGTNFQDTDPDSSTATSTFVLPALSTSTDEYTDFTFDTSNNSIFVTNVTNSEVVQFDAAGPFATVMAGVTTTLPFATSLEGIALTNNDNDLYVFDESDGSVHQYTLTTPGDITTATYVNASSALPFALGLINMDLSADGRELLIIADTGEIYHFRMSTPNDITTLTRVSDIDIGGPAIDAIDIAWSPVSGNHFYVLNADDDSIYEYELDSPYDLSGATLVQSGVDLNGPTVISFDFHSDGHSLFILADTSEIYAYSVDQYFENTISDTAVDLVYLDTDGTNQLALGTSTAQNLLTIQGGVYLASTTPMNTDSALYNLGGDLYWNGFEIARATTTFSELTVTGSSTLQELFVLGDSILNQNLVVYGTTTLATTTIANLNVFGSTTLDSLVVNGDSLLATTTVTNLTVTGSTTLSELAVTNDVTITGTTTVNDLVINNDLTVVGSTTLATTTIDGALLTNLATGSVTFIGEDGLLTEDNENFFYDASTTRLGIGTNTPSTTLAVVGTTTLEGELAVSDNTNLFGRLYAWAESFFTEQVTFEDSLTIATSTPSATSSSIYNTDGDLFWDGRTVDLAFEESDEIRTFTTDPDISTVVDTGVSANLPGSAIAIDAAITSSGTRAYLFDITTDQIIEYTMSTAYDFDTATISGTTSAPSQGQVIEVARNSEYIYLLFGGPGIISQYTLTTPGDISTASLTATSSILAFSSSTISLSLSPDGTQLLTINNDELLSQFELGVPYDITSLTHATSVDLTDGTLAATDVRWSPASGNRVYVLDNGDRTVYEYQLEEEYDISTTTLTQSPVVFAQTGRLSLEFNTDGTQLYTYITANREIETYDVTLDSYDETIPGTTGLVYLNPASSTGYFAVGTSTGQNLVTIQGGVYLASTTPINTNQALYNLGGELYWNGQEIGKATTTFTELTVTGSSTLAELLVEGDSVINQNLFVYGTTSLATTTITNLTVSDFFTVTGTTTFTGDLVTSLTEGSIPFIGPNGLLTEDTTNLFYQASTSRIVIGSTSPSARLTVEGGLTLATGTPLATSSSLYALGEDLYWNGVTVDTAFEQVAAFEVGEIDLSTASEYFTLPLNASSTQPYGVAFNNDGSKLYVVGSELGLIRQYDLLLPYQITSVIGGGVLDVSSTTPNPLDIAFNNDGSKMFLLATSSATSTSGAIYEYTLAENFDLSGSTTLSATSTESLPGPSIVSMEFDDVGSQLFLLDSIQEEVYSYDLLMSYDITDMSRGPFDIRLSDDGINEPYGMTFIESGDKLLISADANLNTIYEYNLTSPYSLGLAAITPDSYSFGSSETQPRGIAASPAGDTIVVVGATDFDLTQLNVTGTNGDQLAGSIDLVYLDPALGNGRLAIGTSTAENLLTVDGGIYIGDTTPANIISALYNVENDLYWNGDQLLTLEYNGDDDTWVIPAVVPIVVPTSATFNNEVTHKKRVTHEGDTVHEKNTRQYYGNFEPGSIVFMEDECFGIGSTSICTGVPYLSEDNDFLYYDWDNRQVGIGTNNPTEALTVDGTALFTQAPKLPYITQGSVPFVGINNSLRDSVGLYWDDANGYFGVGTADVDSVLAKVHVDNGSFLATERNPEQVGALEDAITGNCPTCTIANASDVAVYGNYAVVTSKDEDELVMIDVTDVSAPVQVSEINGASPLSNPTSVTILNDIAYVTDSDNDALYLFDISIPVVGPTLLGTIASTDCAGNHCALTDPESVFVTPNYAYVASPGSDGVAIIDTSNKQSPAHVTSLLASTTGQNLDGAYDVAVDGNFLYVVNFTANSLLSFNVSDPTNPIFVGALTHGTGGADLYSAQDITIQDQNAYIIAATGLVGSTVLEIVDITNPATPAHVGKTSTFHDGSCIAACPSDATDIVIVGDYAYLTFGINDAIIVMDISDATNPTYVGEAVSTSNPKAITVSGKYAFVAAAAGSQFQIYELAGIQAPAAQFGSLEVDDALFNDSLTVIGNFNAKTIQTTLGGLVLDEAQTGGVFFAGPTGAVTQSPDKFFWNDTTGRLGIGTGAPTDKLHIDDGRMLITAGAPVPLGFLDNGTCDGLQGGAGCPLDGASGVHVLGNYAYVSAQDDDGFAIIDISRPASPTYVNGEFDTVSEFIDGATDIYVQGGYAYLTSETDDALAIYSVEDPSQILSADSITDADCDAEVGGEGCALNNPESVIVDGNYAYVLSNGDQGVAVIDVKDSSFPKHVASIFASSSSALLDGAFNMYLRNGYLYIPAGTDGALTIIDVTVPEFPTWVSNATSTINELDGAFDVEVRGRYAYVVSTVSQSLSIVDVYDTSSTSILGYFSHADCTGTCNLDTPTGIALAGNYAFITTETNPGIAVFDISDPWAPTYVAFYADGTDSLILSPTDIEIVGNFAYVTDGADDGLTVFSLAGVYSPSGDISKLAVDDLMIRESLTVQSRIEAQNIYVGTGGITSDGNIAINSSNLNVYDGNILVTEKAPVVTRIYTDSECDSDFGGSDCTLESNFDIEVDPDGDEVYIGSLVRDGITKVNVEDANDPYPVAELVDDVSIHLNGISGMDVFSIQPPDQFEDSGSGQNDNEDVVEEVLIVLSKVENAVSVVSTDDETDIDSDSDLDEMSVLSDITDVECDSVIPNGCVLEDPDAVQTFVMADGYWAMVGSDDGGVAVLDVSDPRNIRYETGIVASTTNFESQPVPLNDPDAILVKGTHAFVASGDEDAVTVIDIAQPRNPVVVDVIEDGVDGAQLDNPLAFEVRGDFMYIASNDANAVEVYDISNPRAAQYVTRLEAATSTPMGSPLSLSVTGDILLVGTSNGVTEVTISNPANPVITGSIVDDDVGVPGGPDSIETTNLAVVADIETDRGKAYAVSVSDDALTIMSMRNVTAPAGIFDNLWVRGDVSLDGRIKTDLLNIDGSLDVNGNLFADNLGVYNNLAVNGKVSIYDGDLIQTVRNYTPQGTYQDTGGGMVGPTDIAVHPDKDMAYVISPSTDLFTQIDIGEPDEPSLVGITTDSQCDVDAGDMGCAVDNPSAIDIKDDYVVVAADAENALSVFDISSTSSEPEIVFSFNDNICDLVHGNCPMNYISDMEIEGEFIFTLNDPDAPEDDEGFAVTLLRDDGSALYLDSIPEDNDVNLAGPGGITVNEDIAYVISSSDDGLTVIDISEPTELEVISTLNFDSAEVPGVVDAQNIEFIDDTLYITSDADDQLAVIDVTDPADPEYVLTIDQNDVGEEFDGPQQMEVIGDTLMIAMSEGDAVTLFDISDRENPLHVASLEDNESLELEGAWGITTDDDAVYVTGNTDNGLQILELPRFQGLLADVHTIYGVEGHFHRLTVDDRMEVEDLLTYGTVDIYGDVNLSSANFVQELDVLDPLGNIDDSAGGLADPIAVEVGENDEFAFVISAIEDRLTVLDLRQPTKPTFAASYDDTACEGQAGIGECTIGGMSAMDLEGDRLVVAGEDDDGVTLLDVSSSTDPQYVSGISDATCDFAFVSGNPNDDCVLTNITDVEIDGNFIYTINADASEEEGFGIIEIDGNGELTVRGAIYDDISNELDGGGFIEIDDDIAYVITAGDNGLTAINVEDKDNPVIIGELDDASITGLDDVTDVELYPEEGVLYVISGVDDQLTVIDVSVPEAMVEAVTLYPANIEVAEVFDHPSSLERIGERLVVTARDGDAILVFDISDPDNPIHIWTQTDTTELELDGPGTIALGEGVLLVASTEDDGVEVFKVPTIDTMIAQIDTIFADEISTRDLDVDTLEVQERLTVRGPTETYDDVTVQGANITVAVGGTSALSQVGSVLDNSSRLLAGAYDIVVQGTTAFVTARNEDAVSIWDISDPTDMVELSQVQDDSVLLLDGIEPVAVSGDLMVVGSTLDDAITLFDISDPTDPIVLGALDDPACNIQATALRPGNPGCPFVGIKDVEIVGDYVFTASDSENGVAVVDISDPTNPQFLDAIENTECDAAHGGECAINDSYDIEVQGDYAFVAGNADDGVAILNVSDPRNIYHATSVLDTSDRLLGGITSITLDGDYLYATAEDEPGFAVIDITDPEAPMYVTEISNAQCDSDTSEECALFGATDSAIIGDYLYVSAPLDDGVSVFDISDPTAPLYIDSLLDTASTVLDGVTSLFAGAGFMFAATGISEDGFAAFSIPTITAPAGIFAYLEAVVMNVISNLNLGNNLNVVGDGDFRGDLASAGLTVQGNGVYSYGDITVDDDTLQFERSYTIDSCNEDAEDETCTIATPLALTVDGDLMVVAYDGTSNLDGYTVFELTDSVDPSWTATEVHNNSGTELPTLNDTEEVVVRGDYLYYLASDAIGVVDLTDPTAPTTTDHYEDTECDADVGGAGCAVGTGGIGSHMIVEGNYAYVAATTDSGIGIFDISDPNNIVHVGSVFDDADSILNRFTGIEYDSGYVYAITDSANQSLEVVDVTDVSNPVHIQSIADNGTTIFLNDAESIVAHNSHLYIGSGDGIMVFDISSSSNPVAAGNLLESIDTNLTRVEGVAIIDDLLYAATDEGLTVVDISDPTTPVQTDRSLDTNDRALGDLMDIVTVGNYVYTLSNSELGISIFSVGNRITTPLLATNDITISGQIDTAFTQGSLLYAGANGVLGQTGGQLYWDEDTSRLGVRVDDSNAALAVIGGIEIRSGTPDTIDEVLYNLGSDLYWDGSRINTAFTEVLTDTTVYGLSLTGVSLSEDISVTSETDNLSDFSFDTTGTRLYVIGGPAGVSEIVQYSLSTAWDISSRSFVASTSIEANSEDAEGGVISSEGAHFYVVSDHDDSISIYDLTTPYDITTLTYDSKISIGVYTNEPAGMAINDIDTKLYLTGRINGELIEFEMDEPNDLSTASVVATSTYTDASSLRDVAFSEGGQQMFLVYNGDDTAYLYNLTTAYDITTAGLLSSQNYDFGSDENAARAVYANGDEQLLYIGGQAGFGAGDSIHSFSTGQTSGTRFNDVELVYLDPFYGDGRLALGQRNAPNLLSVNGGVYLASTTPASTTSALYNLGNALYWNGTQLSTLGGEGVFSSLLVTGTSTLATTTITDLTVSGSSTLSTLLATNDVIFNQDFTVFGTSTLATTSIANLTVTGSTTLATTTIANLFVSGTTTLATTTINGDLLTNLATGSVTFIGEDGLLTEDNENFFYEASTTRLGIGTNTPTSTLTVDGDVSIFDRLYAYGESLFDRLATFNDALTIASSTPSATSSSLYNLANSLYWNDRSVDLAFEEVAFEIEAVEGIDPYDLSTASSSGSIDVPGASFEVGLAFNPDGTKMYITANFGNELSEFDLSTPFDVTTRTFRDSTALVSASAVWDITFNDDGTKLYAAANSQDAIVEYDLDDPYNISTTTFLQSTSTALYDTEPRSVAFNDDGTKMFFTGLIGDAVYTYDLSSAYDVSSAAFSASTTISEDGNPMDIAFNADGTKMIILGATNDEAYGYDLGTSFDPATASLVSTTSVNVNAEGLAFNASGTRMFTVSSIITSLDQYDLTVVEAVEYQRFENSTELVYLNPEIGSGNLALGTTTAQNLLTVQGGVYLASTTPTATSSSLYNLAGDLYWNGSQVVLGGGALDLSTLTVSGTSSLASTTIAGDLVVDGAFFDSFGSPGTAGLVLTSTATGTEWAPSPSSPWTQNGSDIYYDFGRVAIGTTTPEFNFDLDIYDTDNAELRLQREAGVQLTLESQDAQGRLTFDGTAGNFLIDRDNSGTNALRIDGTTGDVSVPNSSVGIGTTTPQGQLHVQNDGAYLNNQVFISNGLANPLMAAPHSYSPTFSIAANEQSGSRPFFMGYQDVNGWTGQVSMGACGSFDQMCFNMGASTTDASALVSNNNNLAIGGRGAVGFGTTDGNFNNLYFGNTGDILMPNNNLFVGTTSTSTIAFTVDGDAFISDALSIGDSVTNSNATRALNLVDASAVVRVMRVGGSGDPAVELIGRATPDGADTTYWDFYADYTDDTFNIRRRTPGGGDYLTIDTAGNVGIGTTTPESILELNGALTFTAAGERLITTAADEVSLEQRGGTNGSSTLSVTSAGARIEHGGLDLATLEFSVTNATSGAIRYEGRNSDIDFVGGTAAFRIGNTPYNTYDPWAEITDNGSSFMSGNVGIGTTSPSRLLSVAGDAYITGAYYDSQGNAGPAGYILQSTGAGTEWVASTSVQGISSLWNQSGADIYFDTGGVGIGTSTIDSGEALVVSGGILNWDFGDHQIELSTPGGETGMIFNRDERGDYSRFNFTNNPDSNISNRFFGLGYNLVSPNALAISYDGNVGIGTTTPQGQLHLQNDGAFRDNQLLLVNGLSDPTLSMPSGYRPSLAVISTEQNASRPFLVGYQNTNGWNAFAQIGACGAFDQLCLSMGASTTDYTALTSHDDDLAIGGRPVSGFNATDGDFTDVYFGNTGNVLIADGGRLGIGTTSPGAMLDVTNGAGSGSWGILAGSQLDSNDRPDDTQKNLRFGLPHYDNQEENVTLMTAVSNATDNLVNIGGNTSAGNAATQINFYVQQDNTTVGGDLAMRVNSSSTVMMTNRLQIGNTNTSWLSDDITGYTDGFFTNDAAIFAPLRNGSVSDLRLYIPDDDVDSFSIWGDTCGGGDCGDLNMASVIAHFEGGGSVGIGTTTPGSLLTVDGSMELVGTLTDSTGAVGTSGQVLSSTGAGTEWVTNTGSSAWTANGSDIYYNLGNVGVGSSSPMELLTVSSGTDGDAILMISADEDNSNENDNPGILFSQDGGTITSFIGNEGNAGNTFTGSQSNSLIMGTNQEWRIQFATNGIVAMTIDNSDQYVAIGHTDPTQLLHISSETSGDAFIRLEADTDDSNDADNAGIILEQDGGTTAGYMGFEGAAGTRYTNSLGNALLLGADTVGSELQLVTNSLARLTVEDGGNIGITGTNPRTALHIYGPEDGTDTFVGPIMTLSGDSINQYESGRIRFTESESTFQGMYIHYEASGNDLHIGSHSAGDTATTSDENMMTFERGGQVGVFDPTPDESLTVVGSFCVKDLETDVCNNSTGEIVADRSITANAFDLAENFLTDDLTLGAAEVVMIDPDKTITHIERATTSAESYKLGVISTDPSMVMGYAVTATVTDKSNVRPVALSGRVPVKVNLDNGPIAVGDRLALSTSTAGVAMRSASATDHVIGIALEAYDTVGQVSGSYEDLIGSSTLAQADTVLMLVENDPASQFALDLEKFLAGTQATSTLLTSSTPDSEFAFGRLADRIVNLVFAELEVLGVRIAEAAIFVNDLFAEKIVVDNLTVGSEAKPSGITFYDENGSAYCVKVEVGGELVSYLGACGSESDEAIYIPTDDSGLDTSSSTDSGSGSSGGSGSTGSGQSDNINDQSDDTASTTDSTDTTSSSTASTTDTAGDTTSSSTDSNTVDTSDETDTTASSTDQSSDVPEGFVEIIAANSPDAESNDEEETGQSEELEEEAENSEPESETASPEPDETASVSEETPVSDI